MLMKVTVDDRAGADVVGSTSGDVQEVEMGLEMTWLG